MYCTVYLAHTLDLHTVCYIFVLCHIKSAIFATFSDPVRAGGDDAGDRIVDGHDPAAQVHLHGRRHRLHPLRQQKRGRGRGRWRRRRGRGGRPRSGRARRWKGRSQKHIKQQQQHKR